MKRLIAFFLFLMLSFQCFAAWIYNPITTNTPAGMTNVIIWVAKGYGFITNSQSGVFLPSLNVSNYLTLDPTIASNPTYAEGKLFYDNAQNTLGYYNDNSQMTVNISQEQIVRVVNKTGSPIADGVPVRISGATGQTPEITPAIGTNQVTACVIGLTTTSMNHNDFGYVTVNGVVNGLDTRYYSEGAMLFLNVTNAGTIQTNRPSDPNFCVLLGYCLYQNNTQGKIYVHPEFGSLPFTGIIGYGNIVTNTQADVTLGGVRLYSDDVIVPTSGYIDHGVWTWRRIIVGGLYETEELVSDSGVSMRAIDGTGVPSDGLFEFSSPITAPSVTGQVVVATSVFKNGTNQISEVGSQINGVFMTNGVATATNFNVLVPYWDDVMMNYAATALGPTAPALVATASPGVVKTLAFDNGDEMFAQCQLPHTLATTNALFPVQYIAPHVHFSTIGAGLPDATHSNVTWQVEWEIASINQSWTNKGTNSVTTMVVENSKHYMAQLGFITNNPPLTISAIFRCRLTRPASALIDYSNAHDVLLDGFDMHFPMGNRSILGSRSDSAP